MQQLSDQNAMLLKKLDELVSEMKPLTSMLQQLVANSMSNDVRLRTAEATTIIPATTSTNSNTMAPVVIPTIQTSRVPTSNAPAAPVATTTAISAEDAFIEFLNTATLEDLKDLKSRAHNDELRGLLNKRKAVGQFKSQQDCLQSEKGQDGLTPGRYDTLLNKWQQKHYSASVDTSTGNSAQNNAIVPEPMVLAPITTPEPVRAESLPLFAPTNEKSVATPLTPIEKLNNMSNEELAVFLSRRKFKKTIIEAIINQRPFASFEAINIEGLGVMSKQKLIQAFNK